MDANFERKVQEAQRQTEAVMDEVDRNKIRPLCKASLLKMAACCDLPGGRPQVDECMRRNQHGMNLSQQIVQNEMEQLSQRVQRCMAECQDTVRDANYRSEDAGQKAMYSCAAGCIDKNMAMLKGVKARIEGEIDKAVKSIG